MMDKFYTSNEEFEADLRAEGKWEEWVAHRKEEEQERRHKQREQRHMEAPVRRDLLEIGIRVKQLIDLVDQPTGSDQQLVPLLLRYLQQELPDSTRHVIAASLARPEAAPYWDVLVKLYRQTPEEVGKYTKGALAGTLARIATPAHISDLVALAKEKEHGESRSLFLKVLSRSKDPRALQTLMELRDDTDLGREVRAILRRKERRSRTD